MLLVCFREYLESPVLLGRGKAKTWCCTPKIAQETTHTHRRAPDPANVCLALRHVRRASDYGYVALYAFEIFIRFITNTHSKNERGRSCQPAEKSEIKEIL